MAYKIITSAVTDPSIQQPITTGTLDFISEGITQGDNVLAQSMIPENILPYAATVYPFIPYVLSGVYEHSMGYTNGVILYNYEVFEVAPFTITTGYTNTAEFNIEVNTDAVTFSDGISRDVHDRRFLRISDAVSGSGLFNVSQCVYVNSQKTDATALNGWTLYDVAYMKKGGIVHLQGNATHPTMGGVIFNLPEGFRPQSNLQIPTVCFVDGAVFPNVFNITTAGDVGIAGFATTGTTNFVYFDSVSFML